MNETKRFTWMAAYMFPPDKAGGTMRSQVLKGEFEAAGLWEALGIAPELMANAMPAEWMTKATLEWPRRYFSTVSALPADALVPRFGLES